MSNRRDFLRILGTGMAAASAGPAMAGASKLKTPERTLKVGVLSPQSNICPQYPYAFMNGFRLGVDQHKALKKQHIEIVNEPNGYGTPFLSKQNTQKLLYENNVDLMVGILGNEVVGQFGDLFEKKQVPFVVCNAGEYYAVSSIQKNPYLFFNTLGFYQSAYASGRYAATKYGKKGLLIASFYDSGYDSLYAFIKGVETAGGEVETHVVKSNEKEGLSSAISKAQNSGFDFVYVLMSGDLAREFVIRYKSETEKILPLLTTPFVSENSNLPMLGDYANGLESFTSWTKEVSNRPNQEFCKNYMNTFRAEPDQFAALGYETGLLVYQALALCKNDFSGQNLKNCLSETKFDSPRGKFSFDNQTGWANISLYRTKIEPGMPSTKNTIREELAAIEATHPDFLSLDTNVRSGWFNPYLFV